MISFRTQIRNPKTRLEERGVQVAEAVRNAVEWQKKYEDMEELASKRLGTIKTMQEDLNDARGQISRLNGIIEVGSSNNISIKRELLRSQGMPWEDIDRLMASMNMYRSEYRTGGGGSTGMRL